MKLLRFLGGILYNITKSLDCQKKALSYIPGMTQLLSKRPDQFSLGVWPGYYSKASGAEVWDLDGNKYLDMSIAGIGANALGYANPEIDNAVVESIRKGVSSSLNCPEEVLLAERLTEIHSWSSMCKFTRSGGEALAVAIRIARAYAGRDKVAFCGYHGWHDWYLASNISDGTNLDGHLLPGLNPAGVPKGLKGTALPFHYNKIAELEEILEKNAGDVAAIIMEPIRNQKPESQFLAQVRQLATQHNCVLIFDEVSSGFRISVGGAHLNFEVDPDMAVFAKALGNGYPIAAIIGTNEVMKASESSFISSTNWTERVGPTAALKVLDLYQNSDVVSILNANGRSIKNVWQECADTVGLKINVGGLDPMAHFGFVGENIAEKKSLFIQCMAEQGILASNLYYAMVCHTDGHIGRYRESAMKAFSKVREAEDSGEIRLMMRGEPSGSGFGRLN